MCVYLGFDLSALFTYAKHAVSAITYPGEPLGEDGHMDDFVSGGGIVSELLPKLDLYMCGKSGNLMRSISSAEKEKQRLIIKKG